MNDVQDSGVRPVFIAVYLNILVVAILFLVGRHAGGSPLIFPALYGAIAVAVVVGVMALNRPTPAGFKIAFLALSLNAIFHYALYVLNDRAISAGLVDDNLLGYLYGLTFTVAITSLGFLCRPESQHRSGFGPVDVMDT